MERTLIRLIYELNTKKIKNFSKFSNLSSKSPSRYASSQILEENQSWDAV